MSTDQRWVADDTLGPRMRKMVETAIRDLSWEGKTNVHLRGTKGRPETERRSTMTSIFLGRGEEPRTDAADLDIRERFGWVLSKKNYKDVIAAYEMATAAAVEARPVIDERDEPEERDRIDVLMAERRAEDEARRAEREAVKDEVKALAPAGTTRVIVAELKEDTSHPQSDYSGNKTVRSVAIGFSSKSREDFNLLHAAAKRFGLESDGRMEERRDNYSMGQGNYLSDHGWDGGGSGWIVRSRMLDSGYWDVKEIGLGRQFDAGLGRGRVGVVDPVTHSAVEVSRMWQHVHLPRGGPHVRTDRPRNGEAQVMSNYPPGVSGNEPEINGYPETTETVYCTTCECLQTVDAVWPTRYEWEGDCPKCERTLTGGPPEPDPDLDWDS